MAGKRKDSKGRLLRRGERQREDGTYEFRYQKNGGKRKSVYSSSLEALRKLEDKITMDRIDGIRFNADTVTLDDVYGVWCRTKKGVKDNTFQNYKYMYTQFISPEIGKCKICKLKKSDVRQFYNRMVDGGGLKLATAESMHTILHQVLQLAVDDNYIRTNPATGALKELKASHQYDSEKRIALTVDQQKLLLSYLDKSEEYRHWKPIIEIFLGTGLRVGELTGLRWEDVDFENGVIDVNHTLVFYNKDHKQRYAINTPKTQSSRRKVPMLDSVRNAFLQIKKEQDEKGLYCTTVVDGYQDFIFCNRFGEVLNLGVLNKACWRIMRDCNDEIWDNHEGDDMPLLLPRFSCHTFRHTFTTRMCESGMNIKVIQGVLGHTDISTTMNIYVDITKELEQTAMGDLSRYLEEKKIS